MARNCVSGYVEPINALFWLLDTTQSKEYSEKRQENHCLLVTEPTREHWCFVSLLNQLRFRLVKHLSFVKDENIVGEIPEMVEKRQLEWGWSWTSLYKRRPWVG